jgi:hypothetical protein
MKKKAATQSAFFNVRVLTGLFVVLAGICLGLLGLVAFPNALAQTKKEPTQQPQVPVSYERIEPASVSVIDFQKLAEAEEKAERSRFSPPVFIELPPPEFPSPTPPPGAMTGQEHFPAVQPALAPTPELPSQLLIPSPQPSLSFLAQPNGALGYYPIPPDTMGAVGPDKLFVMLNGSFRVQDKSTGAVLSEVSGDTFWNSTGTTYGGDPRVVFDPYNSRWLVSSLGGDKKSILVGVSSTSNPQGNWRLFRFIVGCDPGTPGCDPNGESPDFDMLGFNKNWVVVSWSQTGGSRILILNYPALRIGNSTPNTIVRVTTYPNINMYPASTFAPTEETLYMPVQEDGGNARYRLHKITGTPSAPVFTFDTVSKVRPGGGWSGTGGDILPQTCIGTPGVTCPTTLRFIATQADYLHSSVIFRNGNIWYSQTIGLPNGAVTHTAVQWTRINTAGSFVDGGRIEDPTATSSNGGEWYAFPSIAVNANNDVLLGFSNFSSAHLANAGYAFRFGTNAPGTMRTPIIFKQGEDYYAKGGGLSLNRWGDYSQTVADPTNDLDMWTIQEYAQMRLVRDLQQTSENSRWSTWWAKVCNANVSYVITANAGVGGAVAGGGTYACGSNVTLIATPDNYHSFVDWTEGGKIVGTFYEAESGSNTLHGGAIREDCFSCSGGRNVGYVGNNAGTLQFNGVAATAGTGTCRLTIYYVNGDPVVRTAYLSVNGGQGIPLNFPSTGGWSTIGSTQTSVNLNAGSSNTLKFYNPNTGFYRLDFDRIGVNADANYTFGAGTSRTLLAHFAAIPPPGVTTSPATLIGSYSATLNGSVNPHGATTSVYFEYGTTQSYGHTTAGHSYNGNTAQNVSANISGLGPSTTYHFRVVATNIAGTRFGGDRTFTTLAPSGPPVVITKPATNVAGFSATLNGLVDPHGLTTNVHFEYGPTTSYGHTTSSQAKSGNTYQTVTANISGLSANATYHFRIVATNSAGTRYGSDRTFTTLSATGPPIVFTNPATLIASFSARLNGSLDPHGLTTTVYFQYGTTSSYGHTTASQTKTGNTYQAISANISGLSAGTTYHFRIVATNSAGTRYGSDRTFTTL